MLPDAFVNRMRAMLGAEADAFFASYDRPRAVGVRFHKGPDRTALPFVLDPVPWAAHGYYYDPAARPGLHPWHDAGVYYLQEPSAMAPAALLDPQPGERVLDLCAAPGGKSTPERLAERLPGWFDRVLVDAPCSGEGMFRKEEAALTDWSEATVAMCAARQRGILEAAARLLRPGGRLVYSTCTFAPEENELVIEAFLQEHPEFRPETVEAPWFAPGLTDTPGMYRLWPHRLRGEGQFAAVLRRMDGPACPQIPLQRIEALPPESRELLSQLPPLPDGGAVRFGQTLYLVPPDTPELGGARVLRAGLELGQLKKGRFEPAHALALWLPAAENAVDYPADSPEIARFLRGETLPTALRGWVLVRVDGYGLGWGKGAAGVLKNHYPKGLRRG